MQRAHGFPRRPSRRVALWAGGIALVALTVGIYAQTLGFEFVNLDDPDYVSDNAHVLAGLTWEGAVWALTGYDVAAWQPVTWLSLMLDRSLGGPGPRVFHLTNVILHAANTLLLFALLAATTGSIGRSVVCAGLFAAHPLHVESVAWITARKDVLSTFFWLAGLLCYVAYARRKSLGAYSGVVTAFVLALMAKPMAVTFPLTLLVLDYWPLGRFGGDGEPAPRGGGAAVIGLVREKLPLFAISVVASLVAVQAQESGGALSAREQLPLWVRTGNAALSYVAYVRDLIWPTRLGVIYPHPRTSLSLAWAAGAALLLIGVTVVVVALSRRRPYLAAGWAWYVVTLVPVIGLVQFGVQARADRFTYVPLIGLYVILCWGVPDLAERLVHSVRTRRLVLAVAAAAVLAGLSLRAHDQAGVWRDSVTLYRHTLAVTRDNGRAHNGLGMALNSKGLPEEALPHFGEAVRIDPQDAVANANFAAALDLRGDHDLARLHFEKALRLRPEQAAWRANLATALMKRGRTDAAIVEFTEVLRIDPDNASAHNNLGVIFARRGEMERAIGHFEAVLRIEPDHAGAGANLERARRSAAGR